MKFNLGKNGGLLVEIYFEGLSCECKLYNHLKEKKIFEGKLGQVYVNTFENVAFVVSIGNIPAASPIPRTLFPVSFQCTYASRVAI